MKLKTRKAVSKRIKVTGGKKKKIQIRTGGQNHFNSREKSKITTNKRRDKSLSDTKTHHIKKAVPNM